MKKQSLELKIIQVYREKKDQKKIYLPSGSFGTYCKICKYYCHYPCAVSDRQYCCAMNSNGYCTECPGGCHHTDHENKTYRTETEIYWEDETNQELLRRYNTALNNLKTNEQKIQKLDQDKQNIQSQTIRLINDCKDIINKIQEISLRALTLSLPEYIQMQIQVEKNKRNPGYQERIEELQKLLNNQILMQQVFTNQSNIEELAQKLQY